MKKDNEVRIITVISAILSAFVAVFGCMCVLFPEIASPLYRLYIQDGIEMVFSEKAVPILILKSLLPLIFTIIAVVNALSNQYSKTKGIATAVLTVLMWLASSFISHSLISISMHITVSESADMAVALNVMNNIISNVSWINLLAVMMLVSVSSIEIYASKKFSGE